MYLDNKNNHMYDNQFSMEVYFDVPSSEIPPDCNIYKLNTIDENNLISVP